MNSAISQQRRSRHATSGVHHHPLLNGKLQRTLVRIASLVTLGGAIAGIASLLSPSPKPCFVELQLLPAADQWTLRETVIANDIAALRSGRYFRNHIPLIDGDVSESGATKTLLTGQLERLAQMKSSQSLVVYLAGTGIVDGEGELWVAIGDEVAGNGIRLSEILSSRDVRRGKSFSSLILQRPKWNHHGRQRLKRLLNAFVATCRGHLIPHARC